MAAEDPTDDEGKEAPAEEGETKKQRRKRKRKRKAKDDGASKEEYNEDDDQNVKEESDLAEIPAVDQQKTAEVDRTVYIEGIPFTAQPDDVKNFFQKEIDAKNPNLIADCRLPVWHDSGRLRGYGHIVFDTLEHYQAALKLSGKYLQSRYLKIEAAKKPNHNGAAPPTSEPSNKIMLHNLSYDANEEDVQAVMEVYGTIAQGGVRIVRHSGTTQSKGFGYVEYTELASAKKAAAAAATIQIKGRHCRLDYDHGRVRGSFRTADRKLWQKEYGSNSGRKNETPTER